MSRCAGPRMGVRAFAAAAGIKQRTLQKYLRRGQAGVPGPCGHEEVSGQRWWCQRHAQEWVDRRSPPE